MAPLNKIIITETAPRICVEKTMGKPFYWNGNICFVSLTDMATYVLFLSLKWQHMFCFSHWLGTICFVSLTEMTTYILLLSLKWQHMFCFSRPRSTGNCWLCCFSLVAVYVKVADDGDGVDDADDGGTFVVVGVVVQFWWCTCLMEFYRKTCVNRIYCTHSR